MLHESAHEASSIARAGVVGAGQMGSGIAGSLVKAGIATVLIDVSPSMLADAANRVRRIVGTANDGCPGAEARLTTSGELASLENVDLVIEAIPEDEAAKAALFRSLSRIVRPSCILASNTSTIPITRLAREVDPPARFAGMHFFHPVQRMRLVEVIRGERTDDATITRLVSLAGRLDKTPIVVRDGPGFFTTRVLFPYLDRALRLAEEGEPLDAIDEAAVRFGMPLGPMALLDLVGLDTALAIANVMAGAFPDRFRVSPLLEERVRAGKLGRKSGAGFREHRTASAQPGASRPGQYAKANGVEVSESRDQIIDRLILPMLTEAIRTLEEGIVDSPADVDRGVVLGLGFPAERGGILSWCDAEGAAAIVRRLSAYDSLGAIFRPPGLLLQMADTGAVFFPRPEAAAQVE